MMVDIFALNNIHISSAAFGKLKTGIFTESFPLLPQLLVKVWGVFRVPQLNLHCGVFVQRLFYINEVENYVVFL